MLVAWLNPAAIESRCRLRCTDSQLSPQGAVEEAAEAEEVAGAAAGAAEAVVAAPLNYRRRSQPPTRIRRAALIAEIGPSCPPKFAGPLGRQERPAIRFKPILPQLDGCFS